MAFKFGGFPCGSGGKESACNAGGLVSISGEGNGNPLQHSCLGKSHGQRSLVGYNLWCCKELGMTKRLTLSLLLEYLFTKHDVRPLLNLKVNKP